MSRAERIFGEGITYHVIQNCNNGEFLFKESPDFELFLKYLEEAKNKFLFDLHAYQLMQSHIHLIIKTNATAFLNIIMHWLYHGYSEHYNKIHNRKGHFWRDRYKAKIIPDDLYGLACLRYIHRNPVAAGMVSKLENWPWNCYSYYAHGLKNSLITPLPSYSGLGNDPQTRQRIYQGWATTVFASNIMEEEKIFESKLKSNSIRLKRILKKDFLPIINNLKESP